MLEEGLLFEAFLPDVETTLQLALPAQALAIMLGDFPVLLQPPHVLLLAAVQSCCRCSVLYTVVAAASCCCSCCCYSL